MCVVTDPVVHLRSRSPRTSYHFDQYDDKMMMSKLLQDEGNAIMISP